MFEAAADALGIETSALIEQLGEATSLEGLAGEQGVAYDDVRASILAAVQADIDAAVAEGMDQARADEEVIARLTTWLDEGGQLDGLDGPLLSAVPATGATAASMRPMRRSQARSPAPHRAGAPDARSSSRASLPAPPTLVLCGAYRPSSGRIGSPVRGTARQKGSPWLFLVRRRGVSANQ